MKMQLRILHYDQDDTSEEEPTSVASPANFQGSRKWGVAAPREDENGPWRVEVRDFPGFRIETWATHVRAVRSIFTAVEQGR